MRGVASCTPVRTCVSQKIGQRKTHPPKEKTKKKNKAKKEKVKVQKGIAKKWFFPK